MVSFGRIAAGIATGGASETLLPGVSGVFAGRATDKAFNALGNALGPATVADPNFDRSQFGATAELPNPEYQKWLAKKMRLQAEAAGISFMNPQSKADLQAKIAALGPEPPKTIPTALGARANNADQAGANIRQNINAAGQGIVQTGELAYEQGQGVHANAQQQAGAAATRAAPTINTTQSDLARQQQQDTLARLRSFNPSTSGLNALRAFAASPAGPSVAEAQLRMQSARDRRAALSLARSARGGPGEVARALQVAQAEGAAISAETRGQGAILRATEEAQRRGENLTALTQVASGEQGADQQRLGALTQEGNLITGTRGQDIETARDNLGAQLQTMGLNDTQVRFFNDLGERARQASIDASINAQAQGLNAQVAAEQAAFAYTQLAWQMLTTEQQAQLQMQAIQAGVDWNNAQAQNQFKQQVFGFLGTGLMVGCAVLGGPAGAAAGAGAGQAVQQVANQAQPSGGGSPYGSGYR